LKNHASGPLKISNGEEKNRRRDFLEIAAPRPVHQRTAELESALRTLKAAIAAVEGLLR
jgi:hypothetical protein